MVSLLFVFVSLWRRATKNTIFDDRKIKLKTNEWQTQLQLNDDDKQLHLWGGLNVKEQIADIVNHAQLSSVNSLLVTEPLWMIDVFAILRELLFGFVLVSITHDRGALSEFTVVGIQFIIPSL